MGTSASAQEFITRDDGNMEHGHHTARNPRSRGPTSFEDVPNISVSTPTPTATQQASTSVASQPHGRSTPSIRAQPERGQSQSQSHSAYSPSDYKNGDIVFENFKHHDGLSYTCLYSAGERFYIDLSSSSWLPFPMDWYGRGLIVTESVLKERDNPDLVSDILMQLEFGKAIWEEMPQQEQSQSSSYTQDDRAGWLKHPCIGTVSTYMFEEQRNVHCYFDDVSGEWVKLPTSLELESELVQRMVAQVQQQFPSWKDKRDVLAALRVCDYDVQQCVQNWQLIGYNSSSGTSASAVDQRLLQEKDRKIHQLQLNIQHLEASHDRVSKELTAARYDKDMTAAVVSSLQDKVSELEVTARTSQLQVSSITQHREASMVQRPKSSVAKSSVRSLANHASLINQSYRRLRMEVEQGFADCNRIIQSAVMAAMKLPKLTSLVSNEELAEVKALYRKECMQRKLLYNKLQELRGNIRVYARCRKDASAKCVLTFPTDEDMELVDVRGNKQRYRFDKVYSPETSQEQVFEDTCPIVTSCVDGYNICILAYGQTGSGKTFTMMGPPSSPGVNIRAIKELLKITNENESVRYQLTVSMVEIYNEVIQDLLTPDCKVVTVQQVGVSVTMQGLTTHQVTTEQDITQLMDMGMTNRTVASTKMNSESSRSHLLVMLTVEGHDLTSNARTKGTLTLVDLAGSERVAKTEASGQQLVEAAAINRSLSSLGQVFVALGKSALHVPYRNSKLTQVLQPSLSGDAKAALFVAVSPAESNLPETISTLTFGSNAKQIELGRAKKNVSKAKS